jgi:hypothetical protein
LRAEGVIHAPGFDAWKRCKNLVPRGHGLHLGREVTRRRSGERPLLPRTAPSCRLQDR